MNTERFSEALQYASELHGDQLRRGNNIPYISHLMAVAAAVLEHGGDEDDVVTALLHDPIEDQPQGGLTWRQIRERLSTRVLAVVEDC